MSRLTEELEALSSIYEGCISVVDEDGIQVMKYGDETMTMKLLLQDGYPEELTPVITQLLFHSNVHKINSESKTSIHQELVDIMNRNLGSETIFDVIEYLRERVNNFVGQSQTASNDRSMEHASHTDVTSEFEDYSKEGVEAYVENIPSGEKGPTPFETIFKAIDSPHNLEIIHGPVTMEKKSSFQSHFAYVSSMAEVEEFRSVVVTDKRYARATHNIFAYRFTCPKTGTLTEYIYASVLFNLFYIHSLI
jgi:hypothetical protein